MRDRIFCSRNDRKPEENTAFISPDKWMSRFHIPVCDNFLISESAGVPAPGILRTYKFRAAGMKYSG
jgi:hypothetical protein